MEIRNNSAISAAWLELAIILLFCWCKCFKPVENDFWCHSVHCIVLSVLKIVIYKSQLVEEKYVHLSKIIIHIYNCTEQRLLILTTRMEDTLQCKCNTFSSTQEHLTHMLKI